jgi:hypothetical protein
VSQAIEREVKSVGIDPGKGRNPVVRLREPKQDGHPTAFSEHKFLGILSACDMTPGFLDTTNKEFEIVIGARQEGWLDVRKQMGSKRPGDLLQGGDQAQEF